MWALFHGPFFLTSDHTIRPALLNLVENCMNIYYLYLAHVSRSSAAPLLGFASVVMTLSKTVLYWAQEYYCGYCSVGHNDFKTLVLLWIIPNGCVHKLCSGGGKRVLTGSMYRLWIVVPSLIVYQLGKDLVGALRRADRAAGKLSNEKAE